MSFWTETEPLSPANLNNATVPVGGIIMFSGTVATLPSGWALCDGSAGTPDLRGRFIVGAEGSYAQGATGGADTVALSEAQMPSHNHTGPSHTHSGPSHTHSGPSHAHGSGSLATGSAGSHRHTVGTRKDSDTELHNHNSTTDKLQHASTSGSNYTSTGEMATNGAHTHNIGGSTSASGTGQTGASGTGQTGTAGTGNTGTAGSGQAHENRPPFYALAFIQRVA